MKRPAPRWEWPQPPPEQHALDGLRRLVKHEKRRKARIEKARRERYYDELWAEAEFDAWRATRDW